jgi:hypothetical protein
MTSFRGLMHKESECYTFEEKFSKKLEKLSGTGI